MIARGGGWVSRRHIGVEHRDQRLEVAFARGGDEGIDGLALGGEIDVGNRCGALDGQRTSWKSWPLTATVRNRGPSGVGLSNRGSKPRTFV
jgi:hypothetical protein